MRWILVIGAILCLIGLPGLVITSIPAKQISQEIPLNSEGQDLGTLVFYTPEYLHTGGSSKISLSLIYDPIFVAELKDSSIELTSRLDIPSMTVLPAGEGHVKIDSNYPVTLTWQVIPGKRGLFTGRVWLFQEAVNGERILILARDFELFSRNFLGLSYPIALVISIAVLIIGLGMVLFALRLVLKTKSSHN